MSIGGPPTGYVLVDALAGGQGYSVRYDSGPDVYRLTNGSHTVVIGPGMLNALVDGRAFTMGERPVYHEGRLWVPKVLSTHLARLEYRSSSDVFAWSNPADIGEVLLKRVVIDPGHGGHDPGAVGAGGMKEKDVALQVSLELARTLQAKGVETVLTRSSDRFVDLSARARIANSSGADLLVSIHANSSRSRWASGIETLCLSPKVSDDSRSRSAASDYDGRAFGLAYAAGSRERSAFLAKLSRDRYLSRSLAASVQRRLVSSTGDSDRGVKPQNLCVLREAYVPGALVELGFISHPRTEIRFRSLQYRRTLAAAIASGLAEYSRRNPSRYATYASRQAPAGDVSAAAGAGVTAMRLEGKADRIGFAGR